MPQSKYSEDVRQHLSFIQGVITRMNTNSFSMKGWMVAIVSALCAVYASNSTADAAYVYIIAAIIAAILFCFLDAYYLKMEKEYRKLYSKVLKSPEETDFNMMLGEEEKVCFCEAIKSASVWPLYSVVTVLLGVALYLIFR